MPIATANEAIHLVSAAAPPNHPRRRATCRWLTSSSMHRPSCRSWSSRLAYGCSRRCSKKIGLPCVAPGMRISRPGTRIAPAMLRAKSSWAGIKSRSVGPECGAGMEVPLPTAQAFTDADPLNRRVSTRCSSAWRPANMRGVSNRWARTSRRGAPASAVSLCGADPGAAGRVARDTARRAGPGGAADWTLRRSTQRGSAARNRTVSGLRVGTGADPHRATHQRRIVPGGELT